jgi:hypothetical protein
MSLLSCWAAAAVVSGSWPPAELADDTVCVARGFRDLSRYQHTVPVLSHASHARKQQSIATFLPVYASHPLVTAERGGAIFSKVTHAVVWVHGLSGDANTYFCDGMAAVAAAEKTPEVLSIAPWFGNEQVTGNQWSTANSDSAANDSASIFWTTSRWLSGGDNSPSATTPSK